MTSEFVVAVVTQSARQREHAPERRLPLPIKPRDAIVPDGRKRAQIENAVRVDVGALVFRAEDDLVVLGRCEYPLIFKPFHIAARSKIVGCARRGESGALADEAGDAETVLQFAVQQAEI